MNETPLTSFGLKNPAETMLAFHQVGKETLERVLKNSAEPHKTKTLKTWGINAAAFLVDRTTQSIRRLENTKELPAPKQDEKGRRIYTLADINRIRDAFGTRYVRPTFSEPIVIPVTNFKGGVSKTTTSLLLGQKCALDGLKVLFVDLDPQATLTLLMGYIPDVHLVDDDTIATSITENPDDIKRVIKKTYFDGIDIIPGGSDLQHVELILPESENLPHLGPPLRRLKQALQKIKENYDVIIIDCGPNLGALTMNAVAAANAMLVPIPPSMPDFGSFVRFTKTLSELFTRIKPRLDFFRILITKHRGTSAAKELDKTMRDKFGGYILQKHMLETSEVDHTASAINSIYEKPAARNTKTYRRAAESANAVNEEIISAFKEIWRAQSEIKASTEVSSQTYILAE